MARRHSYQKPSLPGMAIFYFLFSLIGFVCTIPAYIGVRRILSSYLPLLSAIQARTLRIYHSLVLVLLLLYTICIGLSFVYARTTDARIHFWVTTFVIVTLGMSIVIPLFCFIYIGNHKRFTDMLHRLSHIRRRNYYTMLYMLFYNFFLVVLTIIGIIVLLILMCITASYNPVYGGGNSCIAAIQLLGYLGSILSGN